jgi:hypothetical protein
VQQMTDRPTITQRTGDGLITKYKRLAGRTRILRARSGSTRAMMILLGVLSIPLALATRQFTVEELPTRDLCVIMLVAMSIVGLSAVFLPPTFHARSAMGMMLMLNSALRGFGFGHTTLQETDGVYGFIVGSTGVWVNSILFLFGYLIWARADTEPFTGKG